MGQGTPRGRSHPRPACGSVAGVAALVLPDGTPIAITGSDDATVRIWNLTTATPIGHPLHVTSPVAALASWASGSTVGVVVGGNRLLARIDVEVDRL